MFMMGDGWDQETHEPPTEIPPELDEISSQDNGIWTAFSHDLCKRLGDRRYEFDAALSRVFCQFLKPCNADEMPYDA